MQAAALAPAVNDVSVLHGAAAARLAGGKQAVVSGFVRTVGSSSGSSSSSSSSKGRAGDMGEKGPLLGCRVGAAPSGHHAPRENNIKPGMLPKPACSAAAPPLRPARAAAVGAAAGVLRERRNWLWLWALPPPLPKRVTGGGRLCAPVLRGCGQRVPCLQSSPRRRCPPPLPPSCPCSKGSCSLRGGARGGAGRVGR